MNHVNTVTNITVQHSYKFCWVSLHNQFRCLNSGTFIYLSYTSKKLFLTCSQFYDVMLNLALKEITFAEWLRFEGNSGSHLVQLP